MAEITESSYASDVADELGLASSAFAEDVTGEVNLSSSAYGEDVAEAINDGGVTPTPTLKVCQYNIGHFNMGMDAGNVCLIGSSSQTAQTYSQFFNYTTQLQRWKSRISGIDADIIGMPEWNNNFGYNANNALVSTVASGIFADYIPSEYTTAEQIAKRISVGKSAIGGWWINTLVSKYDMSNAQDIDLGSTTQNKAYVRVGTVNINGKTVKVGVCHLNWNNPLGAKTDPTYSSNAQSSYDSRQVEIQALVELFKNDPYVILFGDFNTEGPVYGPDVSYDPAVRDYEDGLAEFAPFINNGFTLANYDANGHRLLTSPATNSRPDLPTRPQYPYCYLDNIIVKGFTMSNVQVIDDGNITDHCAVVCDLTLID